VHPTHYQDPDFQRLESQPVSPVSIRETCFKLGYVSHGESGNQAGVKFCPRQVKQEPVTPADSTKSDGPVVEKEPITPALPLLTAHLAEDEQVNTLFRVGSFYDLRCE
jgi:hypothetical protein